MGPTVTVPRVESATGWSEVARSPATPGPARLVAGRYGYREQAHGTVRRRMPASSAVPVALLFGDRLELLDMAEGGGAGPSYGSFIAGFHAGPAVTQFTGTQHGLQVDLTPLGAYQVFGRPACELAHRVTDLADVAPTLPTRCPTVCRRCAPGGAVRAGR